MINRRKRGEIDERLKQLAMVKLDSVSHASESEIKKNL